MSLKTGKYRHYKGGEYEVLGSSQTQFTAVRLISATNGDFKQLIEKELFREDLFYRISEITLNLPPLRDREEDVLILGQYFLMQIPMEIKICM